MLEGAPISRLEQAPFFRRPMVTSECLVSESGFVHLVGAGPGDPDLLTVKALRAIQRADVVVYDRLVGPAILDLVPLHAERRYVGKTSGAHTLPQAEINALLVTLARSGRRVVRLKGGDPFVFGRGSEEARHLRSHGIGFEVIPGITAASGCAAAAGIPLTHRGLAHGVRFVTGHGQRRDGLALDGAALADPDTTLVVYMGLGNAEEVCRDLIAAGLSPESPAAAVSNGTLPQQRTLLSTLVALPGALAAHAFEAPVLLIIGKVVSLAPDWDGDQPDRRRG